MPSPQRDYWVVLLIPAVALLLFDIVNSIRHGTRIQASRIALPAFALLFLCVVSIYTAPFATRGWILLYRPAIGLWMLLRFPVLWQDPIVRGLLKWAAATVVALVFVMGFTAIQWTGKASVFSEITSLFPRWQDFPAWPGGFNPNEWAGAATWLIAPLAALVRHRVVTRWLAIAVGALVVALAGLLFLSQSLSGIAGASVGILFALVPLRRVRAALVVAGVMLLAGNLAILLAPVQSADALAAVSGRPDLNSLEHRAVMWERANRMLTDHPWTGVGIALYRSLRNEYPTPGYEHALLPHPHNEALQFATDLGMPGLVVFGWLVLSVGSATAYAVRSGTQRQAAVAAALCAGLLSHAVFGLSDAIPIWDRFAIIGWALLACLATVERSADAPGSSPD